MIIAIIPAMMARNANFPISFLITVVPLFLSTQLHDAFNERWEWTNIKKMWRLMPQMIIFSFERSNFNTVLPHAVDVTVFKCTESLEVVNVVYVE